ncbi:hypothetical protein EV121DRAFT_274362 [Schizophyllum commune]
MYAVDLKRYPAPPGNIIKAFPHKPTARMCPSVLDRWLLSHHMDDPPPRPSPLDRKNVRPGQVLCQMTRVVIQCTEAGFNDEYFDTYKLLLTLTPCYNDKAPSISSRPITFELIEYRDGTEGRPLWTTWETSTHIFIESRLVVAIHLLGVLTKGLSSGTEQRRTEQRRLAATRGATGSTAATVSQPVVTFAQPIAMQAPSQTPPMAPSLPQFTFHPEYQPHITFATAPSTSSATQAHHADQEGHGISTGESADRTHGSPHTTEYVEAAEARGAEFERRIREAMAKEGLDPILLYDFDDEEEGMEPAEDTDYMQGLGEDPLPAPSAPPCTNSSTPLPVPSHVPEDTDPFHYQHEDARPLPTPADVHPHTAVYIIYFTVFWLHSYFHLPYRACDALLSIFALILAVCRVKLNPTMHTTLKSVMAALGAEPSFKICAVCPSCLEVYPPDIGKRTTCAACNTPLFNSQPTSAGQRSGQTEREVPIPRLQFPYKSLAEQLATLLAIPEMEDEIERSQTKASTCEHGRYSSIFHGRVCQELRAADEEKFFFLSDKQREEGELRLGVSLGVDWFSYHRSLISPSHTSGPMSYCPTEPNGDQVQRFLRILVNELLRLWREGVVIKTTKYPQGRLVRVALVAVVCDKPAAHKLGGFASHNHRCFCTLCWITQDDKTSKKAWERDAQGVVKTHFYHIWVQQGVLRKNKELRRLHSMLEEVQR